VLATLEEQTTEDRLVECSIHSLPTDNPAFLREIIDNTGDVAEDFCLDEINLKGTRPRALFDPKAVTN
jgi:hypothetical protein